MEERSVPRTLETDVTLIVKVTNACNMHCRYCFIEPAIFNKTMAPATVTRVVRVFLDSDRFQRVHFVWHGGEPLLRGRPFFEHIFEEQQRLPTSVIFANSIQTNATHLDQRMLEFLVDNDVHVGLSLDGPRQLNDPVRTLRGQRAFSAYETALRAAAQLRDAGQTPGAIVVVNRTNVAHPETIYAEFKQRDMHLKLNPLARSGLAVTEGSDLGITAEEYGEFLVRMVDAYLNDPEPTIVVEPIRQHVARILDLPGAVHACHFARSCHLSFLGIAPDGDLYPCGLFQGEPSFRYGNIHQMRPEDVALTALFGAIEAREKKVLDGCSRCAFFDLCYGGCMFHSLKNAGRFEEKDYYCAGYKRYFEHLLRRVHGVAASASRTPARGSESVR
jgi:uncharacterized protein